jgi:hypothetical protein
MYRTDVPPLGNRRVFAPGAYEFWGAQTAVDNRTLVFLFGFGNPYSRAYRSAYRRYLRRPTVVRPPMPEAFPYLDAIVVHCAGGGDVYRSHRAPIALRVDPDATVFEADGVDVGRNDSKMRVRLAFQDVEVEVALELQPDVSISRADDAGEHWTESVPARAVEPPRVVVAGKRLEFAGEWRFTHQYGTRPEWLRPLQGIR